MSNSNIEELKNELSELRKTMQDINAKVSNIEQMEEVELKNLVNLKSMESEEIEHLGNLKTLENKELSALDSLHEKRFSDVMSWKAEIWDDCEYKEMNDTKNVVTFMCAKTGKVCSFGYCPKNIVDLENQDN